MELLPWLVGWRAVWALLSTSYYVPDETWQSVEVQDHFSCNHCHIVIRLYTKIYIIVTNDHHHHDRFKVAHKLVFGNGYLTWEWDQGIRSLIVLYPIHPAIIFSYLMVLAF